MGLSEAEMGLKVDDPLQFVVHSDAGRFNLNIKMRSSNDNGEKTISECNI